VPDTLKAQAVSLAVTEMKKQVAETPNDAREHLELSLAYRAAGDVENLFAELDKAVVLSPTKEQLYIQRGVTYLQLGQIAKAKQDFDKAYTLGNYSDIAKYVAIGDIAAGDRAAAEKVFVDHPEVRADVEAILKQLTQAGAK
jgi:Flp pilus assembly protein TadD